MMRTPCSGWRSTGAPDDNTTAAVGQVDGALQVLRKTSNASRRHRAEPGIWRSDVGDVSKRKTRRRRFKARVSARHPRRRALLKRGIASGASAGPAAARRASVGDRHAHGHGGASTSTARGGFVPRTFARPPARAGAGAGARRGKAPANGGGGAGAGCRDANGVNGEGEPPFSEQVMGDVCPLTANRSRTSFLRMDRDIVERVVSEIWEAPASVAWDDIAGLGHAMAAVQELAVWPLG